MNRNIYILLLSVIAAIAGFLFGFDTGVINGALTPMAKTFGIENIAWLKELIVAAVPLGALVGAMVSGIFSHRFGRKNSIIYSAFLFMLGTVLVAISLDPYTAIFGRLIMGFAVGISAMIVPMYLSEISPPKIRGTVIFMFQLAITIGLFIAFVINYTLQDSWREMFWFGVIPSAILGIGMIFMPKSPRWLALKGKTSHATQVLQNLHKRDNVSEEINAILESANHKSISLTELFRSKQLRNLVFLTFGLFVAQ